MKPRYLTTSILVAAVSIGVAFGTFLSWSGVVSAREERAGRFQSAEERQTINVYRRANQAVVFITTITLSIDPFDFGLEYRPRKGTGSGVVVDAERGLVLTNLHVIGDADKIEVTLADGGNYRASLIGYDRYSDVAVLQLENPPPSLKSVPFGDSSALIVGQRVLAIGNPFGLHHTLTTGIVSSLERTVRSPGGVVLNGLIQTDAAINPGNSGGPLLDMNGQLIGINTAILSQSGDSAGIGFAIPIHDIKRILPELLEHGRVQYPDFGWVLVDTNQGPMVLRTVPGGAADRAGVQPIERRVSGVFLRGFVRDPNRADVLIALDEEKVGSKEEVEEHVLKVPRGKKVRLRLRQGSRRGEERTVVVEPQFR